MAAINFPSYGVDTFWADPATNEWWFWNNTKQTWTNVTVPGNTLYLNPAYSCYIYLPVHPSGGNHVFEIDIVGRNSNEFILEQFVPYASAFPRQPQWRVYVQRSVGDIAVFSVTTDYGLEFTTDAGGPWQVWHEGNDGPASGLSAQWAERWNSTSHSGTFYATIAWDGARWNCTTNHGAAVRVGYADDANLLDGYNSSATVANSTISLRDAGGSGHYYDIYTERNTTSGVVFFGSNATKYLQGDSATSLFHLVGYPLKVWGSITTTGQLVSEATTGTAPLVVSSTTKVTSLNVDLLDGYNTAEAATASTVACRDSSGTLTAVGLAVTQGTPSSNASVWSTSGYGLIYDAAEASPSIAQHIWRQNSGTYMLLLTTTVLLPYPDITLDLGSTGQRWKTTYTQYLGATGTRVTHAYTVDGTTTNTWTGMSDIAQKRNIRPTVGTEFIMKLNPVSWEWLEGHEGGPGRRHGLIAQEVRAVVDRLGVEFADLRADNKALGYTGFIAPIIKALQETIARIEALEQTQSIH